MATRRFVRLGKLGVFVLEADAKRQGKTAGFRLKIARISSAAKARMGEKTSIFDPRAHGQRRSTFVEQKSLVRTVAHWYVDRRRILASPRASRRRR
jgi:hypothetical protein